MRELRHPDGSGMGDVIGGGTIIDQKNGYVLTNSHVVDGEAVVGVVLSDGSELVGYIVFQDKAADLAVLQVKPGKKMKLKEVRMASSCDLILGERTIVIGSPRGLGHSVTFGRVSSLSRELKLSAKKVLKDAVQTDAAINPGNSGGPVFNVNGGYIGTVVGYRPNSTGLGFFIKSDTVDKVLSEKMSTVVRSKAVHGIAGSVKLLKKEGKDRQQFVVEKVTGPAAAAGVKPGDVIVKICDRDVRSKFDLERSMWDCKVGDEVTVTVMRDGKKTELTFKMAQWEMPKEAAKAVGSLGSSLSPLIMRLLPDKK